MKLNYVYIIIGVIVAIALLIAVIRGLSDRKRHRDIVGFFAELQKEAMKLDIDTFLYYRGQRKKRSRQLYSNEVDAIISGCFVIEDVKTKRYQVGQSQHVFQRINEIITGRQSAVISRYIAQNKETIRLSIYPEFMQDTVNKVSLERSFEKNGYTKF